MKRKETRFTPWMCLACGYTMDAASGAFNPNHAPGEGDVSLCMNCAKPYRLAAGKWVPMTADEIGALPKGQRQAMAKVAVGIMLVVREDLSKRGGHA